MVEYCYLIPLLPLASSLVIFFWGRWLPKKGAWLGITAVAASLAMAMDLLLRLLDGSLQVPLERSWPWFSAGIYPFEWGILLDGTSITMLLVVCTVSLLVQIYSLGYMEKAERFKRFYAYLSLFTFSMLGLVLANNYLQFFVGWELMGACSYFLISFEFERDAAAAAGNKAFLTTRLGDLGFYAGLLTIFYVVGTFNFGQIAGHLHDGAVSPHMATLIALMLFSGAMGKSAQVPLHVWLPDAMEGPTPVSALIHAATMVAAGVYLVARSYGFFMASPQALQVVACVGGATALFAATIALTATDIKRVLAYSTISQLGYMILALGVMGYTAGLFHLTTHAAFKALLFLGAGSVIHAVHTNEMWKMGSLSKQMAVTFITFFAGAAALAGIPPFAGFYSKEMILHVLWSTGHHGLFGIAVFTAFLTSFYMTRAVSLTFLGEPRDRERFTHAHESPWSMTGPLSALAVLAVGVGWLLNRHGVVEHLLEWPGTPAIVESHWVTLMAVGAAGLGILISGAIYLGSAGAPQKLAVTFRPIHQFLLNKWYIDELYGFLFIRPVTRFARLLDWFDLNIVDRILVDGFGWVAQRLSNLQGWFDDQIVDGVLINGSGLSVQNMGGLLRRLQTGLVQNYLLVITIGFLCLVVFGKLF